MNSIRKRSKGQILVIFVFALVVLLGFTALAIDGGMIFADRRYSQSVADTAAMAGAGAAIQSMEDAGHAVTWKYFTCNNNNITYATTAALNAAVSRAGINGITLTSGITNGQGIEFQINCQQPNTTRIYDRYLEIHVQVTSTVSTSFLHLFYSGPVTNTVESKVKIHPRTEKAYGNAIVSLSDDCGTNQGGIDFDGDSNVNIVDGGVFSNSCLDANGHISVEADQGEGINYNTTVNPDPPDPNQMNPLPTQTDFKLTVNFQEPQCDGSAEQSSTAGDRVISPGNYSTITVGNNEHLVMQPGLYCVSGDFRVTGGFVNFEQDMDAAGVTDNAVTIFMRDGNNSFIVNGGSVFLTAPVDQTKVGEALVSVMLYMEPGNTGEVQMAGNADSIYDGIVYAPTQSITVGGTASNGNPTYNTQLIGKYIKVHGTSDINISYQPSPSNTDAPTLDMTQ